ncbi:MAG TPA: DUF4013 domain-containing protein [Candidatus Woesearchaeota archaeon]|nr:DUF4013 domain-containing protein [Candidatus Woesearchaeota archaeon]
MAIDFLDAVKYPFSSKENIINLLIGSVMNIVWWLLLPGILVLGYVVRFAENTLQGNPNMPVWNTWLSLKDNIKKGFSVLAIVILYILLPFLIIQAALFFSGVDTELASEGVQDVSAVTLSFVSVGVVLIAVVLFLLPMALMEYVSTGRITDAFNLGDIFSRITLNFLSYFVTHLVVFAFFVITVLMISLPFINMISGALLFIVMIFATRIYAKLFAGSQATSKYPVRY